jgi:hypothetical protein
MNLLKFVVLMNQNCLLFDPLSIELVTLILELFTLSYQINQFIFLWIFALIIRFTHKLIM